MNPTSVALATAAVFVWLGMVLAISFLEAPLKFRAPEVTVRIGLGIGRIVFRALNYAEVVLAVTVAGVVAVGGPPSSVVVLTVTVAATLAVQLLAIRPVLNRRSDRVLAGEDVPRSRTHLVYIGFELIKTVALLALGVTLSAH